MASSYSVTRISDAEIGTVKVSDYHIIGAIGRVQELQAVGDDPRSGTYVVVKPDRRMPPLVSRDHPGTDMTPKILLIEVDDPDDQAKIDQLKEELGV
ncbi:hypothetical protein [Halomonas stenophila]|uniref:Uncharacterized protein n=1 Tax=Halomonas stenophila TaxID=795312 RepID=A0A7W5EUH8_9GAMM|nr:hypothetical protein [Halomonas stenophila]MBB3231692.1 hypothetical protein [Halomonas stenophila]